MKCVRILPKNVCDVNNNNCYFKNKMIILDVCEEFVIKSEKMSAKSAYLDEIVLKLAHRY